MGHEVTISEPKDRIELAEGTMREERLSSARRIVGVCPACGAAVLSNIYYVQGRGYIIYRECENRLPPVVACDYRRPI